MKVMAHSLDPAYALRFQGLFRCTAGFAQKPATETNETQDAVGLLGFRWLDLFPLVRGLLNPYSVFAGLGILVTTSLPPAASAAEPLTVTVLRRDLRPLPGVTLLLVGPEKVQSVTDASGRAQFDLPVTGVVTITPSRSGFRFEPAQLTIPDPANPPAAVFTAVSTSTDLALSMVSDDAAPLVGGLINTVITLRNLSTEAATDVTVGIGSLPGLVVEAMQVTQGQLQYRAYGTQWKLPQVDPGASAEVHARYRATLPDAAVLNVAAVQEMDQTDAAPLNNTALETIRTRIAQARLSLTMALDSVPPKAATTLPVRLTIRNDGPDDATQVAIRSYLPPGAAFATTTNLVRLDSSLVIPRVAAGTQLELNGPLFVRFSGNYTLIANVTSFEQQLPPGAPWPEVRSDLTVQPAHARFSLLAFTDPPNPRVGDDVSVTYVAKNEGPDAVSGFELFTQEDSRLGTARFSPPVPMPPPVPGPFVFGEVLPAGAYTYMVLRYSVKAAGDLTNYFTISFQDQPIADGADYPELYVPIDALPADVGLSLDANPKDITAAPGDPVTIEIRVHNDGPQPARGILVHYAPQGLNPGDLDEVIHADRVLRPGTSGYIDGVDPGETVRLRKHFVASTPGTYTNAAEIDTSAERPDLLLPVAVETIRVHVLPAPPPDLGISVSVDQPQVNVGEYAVFIVTVTNRAAQPAVGVSISETDAGDAGFAFETVRSYGPNGDDRFNSASLRNIPRIEPGTSYSMSRTMRVRKPVMIPYLAKITGADGLREPDLPNWRATTQVAGVQVNSDIAPAIIPDRTSVKNGDLVNFAIVTPNQSSRIVSHVGVNAGESAGFQVLGSGLGDYGYFWDYYRPHDIQTSTKLFSEWLEVPAQEAIFSWLSTYVVNSGQLSVSAKLAYLDQLDGQAANDSALVQINSAPASGNVSLRQTAFPANPSVGDFVIFLAEIRNQGPDRITGLGLLESSSTSLELSLNANVNGISGNVATSFLDSIVRLPALDPGQNFVWQRTYLAHSAGNAWRRVSVAGFDQTAVGPLPDNQADVTVQPAQADLQLQFLTPPPATAQVGIPTFVIVRIRNLGPAVATGVKVAVNLPWGSLSLGSLQFGPRAAYDFLASNVIRTTLRPGESATAGFYVTPNLEGSSTGSVQVQQSDQIDPQPANDSISFTLNAGPAPPIPQVLHVRKLRTDFFDRTPIAEIEIDQAALNRFAPFSTFYFEGSSNLRDWEFLGYAGFLPLAPVTYTDHAIPGATSRAYRLRW
jgi:hypothetical protein